MKRFRLIGVSLLAVFALGAVMASGAQAISAPFWSINGTRLAGGKTHNIQAKAFTETFELTVPGAGVKISCKAFKLKGGVLLGSEEANPGTNNEVIIFTECTGTKAGVACANVNSPGAANGTIETHSLKSELVEDAATKKKLLVEFFPAKGVTFVTILCGAEEIPVNGQVVAEVKTDNAAEEVPELGKALKQGKSWLLEVEKPQPTHVWLIKAGVGSEVELEALTADGLAAEQSGTALVLLANSKFESEETLEWSPLP